jgi:hypothetical protein
MKKTRISLLAVAFTGSMIVAGPASAFNVTATGWEYITQSSAITAKVNNVQSGGTAGIFRFTGKGGAASGQLLTNNPSGSFVGICLEFNENITPLKWDLVDLANAPDDALNSPAAPMGAAQASDLRKLLNGAYANWGSATTTTVATALQLAVWEIANEITDTYDLGAGTFVYVTGAGTGGGSAFELAKQYLVNVKNGTWTDSSGAYFAIVNDGAQDFAVRAVPIPAAAWLLGSGLLGLFGLARRKKAATAA